MLNISMDTSSARSTIRSMAPRRGKNTVEYKIANTAPYAGLIEYGGRMDYVVDESRQGTYDKAYEGKRLKLVQYVKKRPNADALVGSTKYGKNRNVTTRTAMSTTVTYKPRGIMAQFGEMAYSIVRNNFIRNAVSQGVSYRTMSESLMQSAEQGRLIMRGLSPDLSGNFKDSWYVDNV